jgi:hypothetical protein
MMLQLATTKLSLNEYNMGYYLTYGIYRDYATLVKAIKEKKCAIDKKTSLVHQSSRGNCKDIERAFVVLQAWFAIVRGPARFWDKETLVKIMTCCLILHNMILEDERVLNLPCFYDNIGIQVQPERNHDRLKAFLVAHCSIENAEIHHHLT